VIEPTPRQQAALESNNSTLLVGPAGTGKSWVLQQSLVKRIESGHPGSRILVLVAEQDHRKAYEFYAGQTEKPHAGLKITTFSSLVRDMVELFWPSVVRIAGFTNLTTPPLFLSYDLAQLLMGRILAPMLHEGAFTGLQLRPQQIISQLLDILNRAALNGISLEESKARQIASWVGTREYLSYFEDAAVAVNGFRHYCFDHNLLDLSLVHQVINLHLLHQPEFRQYLGKSFQHLIVDNLEEFPPVGHRFVRELMGQFSSCVMAIDVGGGYKRFLAADPSGANQFFTLCQNVYRFEENFVNWPGMVHLANLVNRQLQRTAGPDQLAAEAIAGTIHVRYRWDMVNKVVGFLTELMATEDVLPGDIAIIVPYLDGALRHSLTRTLRKHAIPYYLLRRRSIPRDEPRVRAWLTWLVLGHPGWGIIPTSFDVAEALSLSVAGMDPARAQLVCDNLYHADGNGLQPTDGLSTSVHERIGSRLVVLVEKVRVWLLENGGGRYPIDVFLEQLFNKVLATEQFQPEPDLNAAAICDWLIMTAGRFRKAANRMGFISQAEEGLALVEGINKGLVAANPPIIGEPPDPSGVMVSTIYAYLLSGNPVSYQVWLETAATGWWDIPRQPLSNAFIMGRDWDPDRQWTMADDFAIRNELLSNIIQGLTNRCKEGIILANSDIDRRGIRQEGPLWRALYQVREGRTQR